MALDFTQLQAEVSRNTSVDTSAAALIRGIADRIAQAIKDDDVADAEALNTLVNDLRTSTDGLAGAVAENTPAAPNP